MNQETKREVTGEIKEVQTGCPPIRRERPEVRLWSSGSVGGAEGDVEGKVRTPGGQAAGRGRSPRLTLQAGKIMLDDGVDTQILPDCSSKSH